MPGAQDQIQANVIPWRDLQTRMAQLADATVNANAQIALLAEQQKRFFRRSRAFRQGWVQNDTVKTYQLQGNDPVSSALIQANGGTGFQVGILPITDAEEIKISSGFINNTGTAVNYVLLYALSASDNFNPVPGYLFSCPKSALLASEQSQYISAPQDVIPVEGFRYLHYMFFGVPDSGSISDQINDAIVNGLYSAAQNCLLTYELRK